MSAGHQLFGASEDYELAKVLAEIIRKNASIDWNLKESVGSHIKVVVKRLLRQYGYSPYMEALVTELVLEQAKVLTEFEVFTLQSGVS